MFWDCHYLYARKVDVQSHHRRDPKCSRRLSGRQWGQTYSRITDDNSVSFIFILTVLFKIMGISSISANVMGISSFSEASQMEFNEPFFRDCFDNAGKLVTWISRKQNPLARFKKVYKALSKDELLLVWLRKQRVWR